MIRIQYCIELDAIYILLSIKTRIETSVCAHVGNAVVRFISYYPLKQGLKPLSWRVAWIAFS